MSELILGHPKEIADETIGLLKNYIKDLIDLSRSLGQSLEESLVLDTASKDFSKQFVQLIDGVQTFTEAVREIKAVLRVGLLQTVYLLEVDLASILQDLLDAQEKKDAKYQVDLLREHLPQNFIDWIQTGLPALSQFKDN